MNGDYAKILRRLEAMPVWHKIADPAIGWLASKTTGWTADSFSGGLEVDFSAVVPVGTKAVRVAIQLVGDGAADYPFVWWRPSGDANVSNTPSSSNEEAFKLHRHTTATTNTVFVAVLWLSADYKVQIAIDDTGGNVYIAYPVEWLG